MFLLPMRCYDSVVQLKQAVFEALHLLGTIRVKAVEKLKPVVTKPLHQPAKVCQCTIQ